MKALIKRYRDLSQKEHYAYHALSGFILLIISFIVVHYAATYATEVAGAFVRDLFLDHLPLWDVNVLHIHVALTFWLLLTLYLFTQPQWLPFVTKTAAVFILVRSGFICLTHLGAPENLLTIPNNMASYVLFDGDLFFSGHVGGPFLMLLIFWEQIVLRSICLIATLFFSMTVLIGHIHYSIDVFAAPFIAYGVYQFCCYCFTKERAYVS